MNESTQANPSPRRIGIDLRLVGANRTGDEVVFTELTRQLIRQADSRVELHLFVDSARNADAICSAIATTFGLRHTASQGSTLTYTSAAGYQVYLHILPATNRYSWNAWYLPRALARLAIDVYHTQYIAPLWLPESTKLFTHIHDVSFAALPQYIAWQDRLFLSLLIPRSLRMSTRVVVPSQFTASECKRYYQVPEAKILVVLNALGHDWSNFESIDTIRATQSKYGIVEPYFAVLGTMQPRKNIALLIRAYATALESHPSLPKLLLIGNKSGYHVDQEIDQLLAGELSKQVVFPGFLPTPDLRALVAGASALLVPSLYEGFGLPILEAMSQGVPILASDIPPFREVGGPTLDYIAPTDLAKWAEMMYTVSMHQSNREASRALYEPRLDLFHWENSGRKLLAAYLSV